MIHHAAHNGPFLVSQTWPSRQRSLQRGWNEAAAKGCSSASPSTSGYHRRCDGMALPVNPIHEYPTCTCTLARMRQSCAVPCLAATKRWRTAFPSMHPPAEAGRSALSAGATEGPLCSAADPLTYALQSVSGDERSSCPWALPGCLAACMQTVTDELPDGQGTGGRSGSGSWTAGAEAGLSQHRPHSGSSQPFATPDARPAIAHTLRSRHMDW